MTSTDSAIASTSSLILNLTAGAIATTSSLSRVRTINPLPKKIEHIGSIPATLKPCSLSLSVDRRKLGKPCSLSLSVDRRKLGIHAIRSKHASVVCSAALNARCAEGQTQTVTRESSTITVAPVQGKEKSPELDDGGDGFPPRDDGDGGGGGGGGGNWSGGFFFFAFLAFLGLLKDQESEGPTYRDERRR